MGAGGWLVLRDLGAGASASGPQATPGADSPTDTEAVEELPAAVKGRKRPEDYGFPSYPTAMQFHSMEMGKEAGSAAYSVTKGTSAEIVRFYVEKLGAEGWQYQWKRPATVRPGAKGKELELKGSRVRWIHRRRRRQLTLLTLDDTQKGRTAQAVLSWTTLEAPEKEQE